MDSHHAPTDPWLEWFNMDRSALFTNQTSMDPHAGSRYGAQPSASTSRHTPYSTARRPVRVFKNIESVPDITLNYAQFDACTGIDSTLSPMLSDFSSSWSDTDSNCYTPPSSSTPASTTAGLSPKLTFDQIFDYPHLVPYALSPLPSEYLLLPDDEWENSPTVRLDDDFSVRALPKASVDPIHSDSYALDLVPRVSDDEFSNKFRSTLEENGAMSPEHHRLQPSHLQVRSLSPSFASDPQGCKQMRDQNLKADEVQKDFVFHKVKIEPEYSPFSPYGSHLSPPISPSPSATPEIRNPLKRKLEDCSPSTTPLNWPPSPSFSVLSGMSSPSSSASKSVNEEEQEQEQDDKETSHYDLDHDFEVAKAMSQRRSLRARTAISYAGCEVDSPQEPIRGKMKARTAGQISSDEFKLHSLSSSPKKRRPRGKAKPSQNAEEKVLCPFSIVCSTPFGRFSDVVRHLEANALHTHTAEARWVCPQCHACLARADSYKRHVNTNACGKRAPVTKHKPSYSSEIETELERIRNSDHPAVCAAKERLR